MRAPYRFAILVPLLLVACSAAEGAPDPAAALAGTVSAEAAQEREGFVVGDPAEEGLDATALATLVSDAKAEHSDAVVLVRNGKLVYENYFGTKDEPIMAMSASKSFVDLAYGFLIAEGKLASLDETIAMRLPTFADADARKRSMTYRHLLSQTSGIDPDRAMMHGNDIEAHGIAATCKFEPGTSWQYSNGGVDLLSALAGRIAGEPLDVYLNERLFQPLGIAPVDWVRDDKGVPFGAGEMKIRPLDMAKVGQMLLAGNWHGKEVVRPSWATLSLAQSSPFAPGYGLLWWRFAETTSVGLTPDVIAQWKTAGEPDAVLEKLQPLVGRTYEDNTALFAAVQGVLTADEMTALNNLLAKSDHLPRSRNLAIGPVWASVASGWLGQFLVLVPEKGLVGVRMRRSRPSDYTSPTEVDGDYEFSGDVWSLVP